MMRNILLASALSLLVVAVACQRERGSTAATGTPPPLGASATPPAASVISYVAPDPQVFVPSATIDGWINSTPIDHAAIAQHAWALWAAITADSGQTLNGTPLPVWETWYDTTEVYRWDVTAQPPANAPAAVKAVLGPKNRNPKRRLHPIVQQLHHGVRTPEAAAATSTDPNPGVIGPAVVLSFNRFTREMYDHVGANNYYQASTLTALNEQFTANDTPIVQRAIQPFPATSVMMKPVFVLVSGTQPTMLPYWNGINPSTTSSLAHPTPETWKQCVLVDPTGKATNDTDRQCNGTTMKAGTYQVFPVSATPSQSAFYAFQLTQAEVDDIASLTIGPQFTDPQPGDYALFVATHLSSREIDNWTWQTFWWQPNPDALPSEPPHALSPPANLPRPWNMYASCTAYYMVDPSGVPRRCYNPYLETNLGDLFDAGQNVSLPGITSNCMSCHRASAWPQPGNGNIYATDFLLEPSNPLWFGGKTKLDFAWSMANYAH